MGGALAFFKKVRTQTSRQAGPEAGLEGQMLADVLPKREKLWIHYKNLRQLNFFLVGALLTDFTNGYDGGMLNGLQSMPQWQEAFDSPTGSRLGVITNGNRFGQVACLFIVAWVTQKYGRRVPIAIGSVILLVGVILQAAASNYAMFVLGRVLIGFGNTMQASVCPILISELAYPTSRPAMVGFANSTGSLGSLVAAWVTFGTLKIAGSWSWRLPSLLQAMSSVIQLTFAFLCPESPRWLVYNNRREEAYEILKKYHAEGDENSALLNFEMAEIDLAIEAEKTMSSSKWSEWYRTKGNAYRFMIVLFTGFMLQWCGNALISYYLHQVLDAIHITDAKSQLIINGCININSLFWGNFWSYFIDRIGRRPMFLGGFSGMLCAFIVLTAMGATGAKDKFTNHNVSNTYIAMIFVFNVFYKMAGPVVPVYVAEVSPFDLRAKAFVVNGWGDAASNVFSNFTNPIAMAAISWKYYIVWCAMLTSNFIITYLLFPETKGLSLEEVNQKIDSLTGSQTEWTAQDVQKYETEHVERLKGDDVHEEIAEDKAQ